MPSDFKDPPRYEASPEEWSFLRSILLPPGTPCACGCGRAAESLHHLVNRSQGGDDVVGNLVPLAGDGTRLCHGAITSGNRTYDLDTGVYILPEQVRAGIRKHLHMWNIGYVKRKEGRGWLDKMYPA